MKPLIFILLASCCLAESRPPEVWLYQRYNSFMWIIQKEPVEMPDSWHFSCARADVMFMNKDNALKFLLFNWLDPKVGNLNMNTFAVLAKGWKDGMAIKDPNAIPDPNTVIPPEPTPTVWYSFSGSKYHKQDCRYVSDTFIEVDIILALKMELEPCSICKPMFYAGN